MAGLFLYEVVAAAKLVYSFFQCARWGAKTMDKARQIRRKLDKMSDCGIASEDEIAEELFKTEEWRNVINYCGSTAVDSYTTP